MGRGTAITALLGILATTTAPLHESRPHAQAWSATTPFLQEERIESHASDITAHPACDVMDHNTQERLFSQNGTLYSRRENAAAQPLRFRHGWDTAVTACDIDATGTLWLGVRGKGVATRASDGDWAFYTGDDGLPFDEFTAVTAEGTAVWFGTTRGAIRYHDGAFSYRNAPRWLPDEHVRAIAANGHGVDILTDTGITSIIERPMTLEGKAVRFEQQIAQRHNRDGFVCQVSLPTPGERTVWKPKWTDNDGLWTALYAAAESFRYATTGDETAQENARRSIDALIRLQEVTGIAGFPARAMWPTTQPDPSNEQEQFSIGGQKNKRRTDPLWKVLPDRWPISADGRWYWKSDTSGAEIDGHMFAYATYYDLSIKDEHERERVRHYVSAMMDHIVKHGYALVDYDGTPTRFGWWGPTYVNAGIRDVLFSDGWRDVLRKIEGRLSSPSRSLSLLAYLKTAAHITGDEKYERRYRELVEQHHYAQNIQQAAYAFAPRAYYDGMQQEYLLYDLLLRYEEDPNIKSIYAEGLRKMVEVTRQDRNPLFNFIGAVRVGDTLPEYVLRVGEGIETLKDIPLDTIEYTMHNSHRKDLRAMWSRGGAHQWNNGTGKIFPDGSIGALPISELSVLRWSQNPFFVDRGRNAQVEEAPTHYLLPYYFGRHYRLITAGETPNP